MNEDYFEGPLLSRKRYTESFASENKVFPRPKEASQDRVRNLKSALGEYGSYADSKRLEGGLFLQNLCGPKGKDLVGNRSRTPTFTRHKDSFARIKDSSSMMKILQYESTRDTLPHHN